MNQAMLEFVKECDRHSDVLIETIKHEPDSMKIFMFLDAAIKIAKKKKSSDEEKDFMSAKEMKMYIDSVWNFDAKAMMEAIEKIAEGET